MVHVAVAVVEVVEDDPLIEVVIVVFLLEEVEVKIMTGMVVAEVVEEHSLFNKKVEVEVEISMVEEEVYDTSLHQCQKELL